MTNPTSAYTVVYSTRQVLRRTAIPDRAYEFEWVTVADDYRRTRADLHERRHATEFSVSLPGRSRL
jgi:hypothetical protein